MELLSFVLMFILSTSGAKRTKVFGNEEPPKTGNTENVSDNTKEEDSENSNKKLKDISKNIDKEIYE